MCFAAKKTYVHVYSHLRMTLVQHGFFGDPDDNLKILLNNAWLDYKAWCQANGVYAGQGRFTPGLVTRQVEVCRVKI